MFTKSDSPNTRQPFGRRIAAHESKKRPQAGNQENNQVNDTAAPGDANSFIARTPETTFDDLILPPDTRRKIDSILSLITHHDVLYRDWGLSKIDPDGKHLGINFYGEPGTGKTRCADALAHELGKGIIEVCYTEIESKYVGETGKNIVRAFAAADESGAVLFFDEADSILGRRMTNVTQAADHGVNVARAVMLKQLDAFDGVVVFATNLARNFDSAFVRRIPQHVEIPLPNESARAQILQLMIADQIPGRGDLDWESHASRSVGLSGGDIKNAVVAALTRAVSRVGSMRCLLDSDLSVSLADVGEAKAAVGESNCVYPTDA